MWHPAQGGRARVQVKSTTLTGPDVHLQHGGAGGEPYKRGMLDSFAVYLVEPNLGYILPFEAASHKKIVSLQFTPEKEGHLLWQ